MKKEGLSCGISILAGGLSQRMTRDKAGLRLGDRSLLSHIRAQARKSGLAVRVVRRDLVPRCGPLGGVYTALKTSTADAEIFLACDMPFVSVELLGKLRDSLKTGKRAVFSARQAGRGWSEAGFPFVLPVSALEAVEKQIQKEQFSLQKLARKLGAKLIEPAAGEEWELFNVNTPEEFALAREHWNSGR